MSLGGSSQTRALPGSETPRGLRPPLALCPGVQAQGGQGRHGTGRAMPLSLRKPQEPTGNTIDGQSDIDFVPQKIIFQK